jgi:hypothetical protein
MAHAPAKPRTAVPGTIVDRHYALKNENLKEGKVDAYPNEASVEGARASCAAAGGGYSMPPLRAPKGG